MREYVIGDIHGSYRGLCQCLNHVQFDKTKDRLICLGDVCDGWSETKEVINELLGIKHLVQILGNHDAWLLEWFETGNESFMWFSQGGEKTIQSYGRRDLVPKKHIRFLRNALPYYMDINRKGDRRLFVHGGYNWHLALDDQKIDTFIWDRHLIYDAFKKYSQGKCNSAYGIFKHIFVGHTPTLNFDMRKPGHFCNVWALDTGAGWDGRLTIMDSHTFEYWQSDPSPVLYPKEKGRHG